MKAARVNKNDEFYTQLGDIETEMGAYVSANPHVFRDATVLLPCDDPERSHFTLFFVNNFHRLGLKKLISTSCSPLMVERNLGRIPADASIGRGRVLTMTRETSTLDELSGDGDFRSPEVTQLRDEADFVITNPPFSLFRQFLAWVVDGGVKFSIIGDMTAVTNRNVFRLFHTGKLWYGPSIRGGDREFMIPEHYPVTARGQRVTDGGEKFVRVKGVRWWTNIPHGHVNEPLVLRSMGENLASNTRIRNNPLSYVRYDNYEAIEVPSVLGIPSDYGGVMGVPITFLDKFCPGQFVLLGLDRDVQAGDLGWLKNPRWEGKFDRAVVRGRSLFSRVFIRRV